MRTDRAEPEGRGRDPLILVLNPNPVTRASLFAALEREGYLVATEGRPEKAAAVVSRHQPEVVLVGNDLLAGPHRDLQKRIRAAAPRARVVVTAPGRAEDEKGRSVTEVVRGELHEALGNEKGERP